jgi:hypothetical protein
VNHANWSVRLRLGVMRAIIAVSCEVVPGCTQSHDVRAHIDLPPSAARQEPVSMPNTSLARVSERGPAAGVDGRLVDAGNATKPSDDARTPTSVDQPDDNALTPTAADQPAAVGVDCTSPAADQLPNDLACAGLYMDLAQKQLAPRVRMFQPAEQLWSDGADKTRWIYLPEETQIDASDPNEWKFPIGTKLFKEFRWRGRRAETRMFWKVAERRWLRTSYRWNEAETRAERFGGGDVQVAGDSYYIPSAKECDQCHKGRSDNVLGFEAVLLGLPNARGLGLAQLRDEQLITHPESFAKLELGDDGTGHGAEALLWLHVNCGVSCHNDNAAAEAYSTQLRFRLSVSDADGSNSRGVAALKTTVGVAAVTPRWQGRTRLVPGAPEDSLVYSLMSNRDPQMPRDQMPPIASRVVPSDGAARLQRWIASMTAFDEPDAGP